MISFKKCIIFAYFLSAFIIANHIVASSISNLDVRSIPLDQKIGAMILIGFSGTTPTDQAVIKLADQIQKGHVGGVILFHYNIENNPQVKQLTHFLSQLNAPARIFIAVDQEGGKVQRLTSKKGFPDFMSAKRVAVTFSVPEAMTYYREMGSVLRTAGFNLNFAPVVDLDNNPTSPVIGGLERSYSDNPDTVVAYANAMIFALKKEKILSCIKHFPGHGSILQDTHEGVGDSTNVWRKSELIPFYKTIEIASPDMVMTAHIINRNLDPDNPATLSPKIIQQLLRDQGHFNGVVVSDDLHMGAILKNYGLEETIIKAIQADIDILVFSNNPAAAKGYSQFQIDPDLPEKVIQIVKKAIQDGRISTDRIDQSFQRIQTLKKNSF